MNRVSRFAQIVVGLIAGVVKGIYVNSCLIFYKYFLMKKLILMFLMVMSISGLSAQTKTCCFFDGFWSDWKVVDASVSLYGSWDSFIMFDKDSGDKWEPQFKMTINNFSVPNKKQRKKDVKANVWYEFDGTVEYNMPNDEGTILDWFRVFKGPLLLDKPALEEALERDARKVVSRATIKIQAFEKQPSCYNIYFDNVGVGISFRASNWKTFD